MDGETGLARTNDKRWRWLLAIYPLFEVGTSLRGTRAVGADAESSLRALGLDLA